MLDKVEKTSINKTTLKAFSFNNRYNKILSSLSEYTVFWGGRKLSCGVGVLLLGVILPHNCLSLALIRSIIGI